MAIHIISSDYLLKRIVIIFIIIKYIIVSNNFIYQLISLKGVLEYHVVTFITNGFYIGRYYS